MAQVGDIWYRLRFDIYDSTDLPHYAWETYAVVEVTPKGVWLVDEFLKDWVHPDGLHLKGRRWVNLDWKKKFAAPTKEEAVIGFLRRREKQIEILKRQLVNVTFAVNVLKATGDLKTQVAHVDGCDAMDHFELSTTDLDEGLFR